MISDYEFYSWIVLGVIALIALGKIYSAGKRSYQPKDKDDNYYIHP